ncbi:MAG: thiamine phosphate synthase [Clostridia bacterium]|nr:thiamine phosphate synthase [Clostridia bacterium]
MSTCKTICITNRHLCQGDFLDRIELIARAKPSAIILREKDLSAELYADLYKKVSAICEKYGAPCFIHYFAETAISLKAKIVHLPLDILRIYAGQFEIAGTSCHSVEDALEAEKLGCRYIIAGHIFPTECKKGAPERGLEFLKEVCRAVNIPVYAIGGINESNAKSASDAGAVGVCSMSGFMQSENIPEYIKALGGQNG